MKVKDVIIWFGMASTAVFILTVLGFWVYLAYMAFALDLHTQTAIVAGLFFTSRIARFLAMKASKVARDASDKENE